MPNGLPPLPIAILNGIQTAQLAIVSATSFLFPLPPPVYGIFNPNTGAAALTGFTSVVGFGFQLDEKLATYPIEQGGFGTYNKVAMPFAAKLTYTVNGGVQAVGRFLSAVQTLVQDTNLYSVVTPFHSWKYANAFHYDYKQTAHSGVSLLTVDVWLSEVRQPYAASQYTSTGTNASGTATQTPDGQAQQQNGSVQYNALGTTSDPFPTNALGTSVDPFTLQ